MESTRSPLEGAQTPGETGHCSMIRIHSSLNSTEIHNMRNALEASGIACEVRGEFRRSVMGEIPVADSFVELWLLNDNQEHAARQLLSAAESAATGEQWTCWVCRESIGPEFGQCWNCQA